ncbi:AzlC family ABC transporter permease [Domibacillus epiphyticus]|uniref:Branched-chain amino acid ABC transporter permease n=1 Tax=Domibacillus epiphyticus TaxID=1714355 RepID=A0A1V2A7Z7_9BACI|nr:AzlC family ABC transporter permease [Domibacillus epiphyticus]OMP67118.1 branched-chain amino acid ABC transporter permease [Domibacillus epiphyticus]
MEAIVAGRGEFKEGLYAGIGIAIGYFPAALTYGLLAKSAELSFVETMSLSIFVFAGAAQYIALNLIALGTGIFEIVLTTFILNIRHFLMSAALNEKAENESIWKKSAYAFGVTDETFSVAAMREGSINSFYMAGLVIISYSSWVISSGLGYIAGNALPQVVQESMGIALYAMFIGLLVPSLKQSMKAVLLAGTAALLNCVFIYSGTLSTGWAIIISTLLAAVAIEAADQMRRKGRSL